MTELNKKLAEWRFPDAQIRLWSRVIRIKHNTILHPDYPTGINHFTHSLDACFKWLVPLVGFDTLWIIRNPSKIEYCWGHTRGEMNDVICWSKTLPIEDCLSPIDKDPATAFCLAVEKLLEETQRSTSMDCWE